MDDPLLAEPTGSAELPSPQQRPRRVRVWWLAVMTPVGVFVAVVGGCTVWIATGGLDECDHRPPGSLVQDLPEIAEVLENESNGRDCGRFADISARGAEIEEVEEALVAHFGDQGWVLAEDEHGWGGSLTEGSHSYRMSMDIEFFDGYFLEPEDRVGAERFIQIVIDPWGAPDPTIPSGSEVTGSYLGSPRFVAGNVLVPTGERVTAYSPVTGDELWQSDVCPSAGWASPIEGPDSSIATLLCGGDYYGLDGSSGEFLWWYSPSGGFIDRTRTGSEVLVYTSEEQGLVWVIDKTTGEQRWSASTGDASLAADQDRVFVASDRDVVGYDASTGDGLWSAPFPSSGLYANDRGVFARGSDQVMRRLDAETGAVLWETDRIDERIEWSEVMAVTDRAVVVQRTRGAHEVTVFDIENGAVLWTVDGEFEGDDEAQLWASAGGRAVVITDLDEESIKAYDDLTGELIADLGRPGSQWASIRNDQVAFVYLDDTVRQLGIESLD